MRILAISGSARQASTNTELLRVLAGLCPTGVQIEVFHTLHQLPVFSPDLEGDNTPHAVQGFIDNINQADGVIISSPEYVRAIPGGLKNAIDWLVSGDAIINKPVALIHASHRGDDMLAALRLVLATVTSKFQQQVFMRVPLISKSPQQVRDDLSQTQTQAALRTYINDFVATIRNKPQSGVE